MPGGRGARSPDRRQRPRTSISKWRARTRDAPRLSPAPSAPSPSGSGARRTARSGSASPRARWQRVSSAKRTLRPLRSATTGWPPRAALADASIDRQGPHRLLAIVLLRAPGWPMGPGDPEAALPEARAAAQGDPAYAPNQLALGEALRKNGREAEARAAFADALRLADQALAEGDPDAQGWADDA